MLTIYDEFEPEAGAGVLMHRDDMPCRRLWAAVFRVGLQDAAAGQRALNRLRVSKPTATINDVSNHDQRQALRWIHSDEDEVGSFVWLCELFAYQPQAARDRWRMKINKLTQEVQ